MRVPVRREVRVRRIADMETEVRMGTRRMVVLHLHHQVGEEMMTPTELVVVVGVQHTMEALQVEAEGEEVDNTTAGDQKLAGSV